MVTRDRLRITVIACAALGLMSIQRLFLLHGGQSAERRRDSTHPAARETAGLESQPGNFPPGTAPDRFKCWRAVEDLPTGIAQFHTVFWEPDDTESLRRLIRESDLVRGQRVLEIGTGTGLVALCCLIHGAAHVVATDINPHAIANARFNAARFPVTASLDVRLVSETAPGAFAVLGETEQFDLILSNPPWEDGKPTIVNEYALYDQDFALLDSLLSGLDRRLRPDGRALLAYGCVTAIRTLQERAAVHGLIVTQRDERNLDDLPEVFLPGMLLEVKRGVAPD